MNNSSNNNLTFIDIINILDFILGLKNLDMNITQNDMQELQSRFNTDINEVVSQIHQHLQEQDDKIDEILKILNNKQGEQKNDR